MELLENAKRQLLLLTRIEQSIQTQQKETPKECLRISKSNGVFQYYTIKNGKRCYIRKKNLKIAQDIAQRDYNKKITAFLKENIQALRLFTKHYSPQKCENYYKELPAARKLLIKPAFLDKETFAKNWQSQKYEPNRDFPEGKFFTTKDEHVRSKSEVIIANLLYNKGIPYHYETPVKISSTLTFHPDFLCLNKRTRQEFYWEHCGKMDDSEYSSNLVKRLAIYAQKNIIPGKNLILTMETLEQPLNTKDIERIIEAYLE